MYIEHLLLVKIRAYFYNLGKIRVRKRKTNMASDIHSHQHLMGPALVAGGPTLKFRDPL